MRIYFDALNVGLHAINQPQRFEPGSTWRYRNSDPLSLMLVARRTLAAGGDPAGSGDAGDSGADDLERWLRFPQRAPADAYYAAGFMGQRTLIVPSRDLVVARHGPSAGGFGDYFDRLVGGVLEAIGEPVE